jgi:hypothetical protein
VWCVVCGVWCVVCGVWCGVVIYTPNTSHNDVKTKNELFFIYLFGMLAVQVVPPENSATLSQISTLFVSPLTCHYNNTEYHI